MKIPLQMSQNTNYMNNKCCEKCETVDIVHIEENFQVTEPSCKDRTCPCHTDTTPSEGWEEEIRNIIQAPIRAQISTADIRVPAMSSTGLGEKVSDLNLLLQKARKEAVQSFIEEDVKKKLGFMRQWLNEDRITDPKKMVSTEELLTFFNSIN